MPALEAGTALRSMGNASVSAVDQTTNFVAAHTFAAKSPVAFRAWRSLDSQFSATDDAASRPARFARPVSMEVKIADRQPGGAALVGIIELRI